MGCKHDPFVCDDQCAPAAQRAPEQKSTDSLGCVGWRQTGGCDPHGGREAGSDQQCSSVIQSGMSGYCECEGGAHTKRVVCEHPPFKCAEACRDPVLRAEDAAVPANTQWSCLGWVQTGGCTPDGPLEPSANQPCGNTVVTGNSGFCKCGGGRVVTRVACAHAAFTCHEECEKAAGHTTSLTPEQQKQFEQQPNEPVPAAQQAVATAAAAAAAQAAQAAQAEAARAAAAKVAEKWSTGCVGWRQTGGCNANGNREQQGDKRCHENVHDGISGYCECEGGRRAKQVGCKHKAFQCANECTKQAEDLRWSDEADHYEVRDPSHSLHHAPRHTAHCRG